MIVANIKDCERYYCVNPHFPEAFEFLKKLLEGKCTEGISREGFRIGVPKDYSECFDTNKDGSKRQFEAHRDYLDIHFCIDGAESIIYKDVAKLTPVTEYDSENDYLMLDGEGDRITLRRGDFCIVFPEDAHIPQMSGDENKKVLKTVVKIKVS